MKKMTKLGYQNSETAEAATKFGMDDYAGDMTHQA